LFWKLSERALYLRAAPAISRQEQSLGCFCLLAWHTSLGNKAPFSSRSKEPSGFFYVFLHHRLREFGMQEVVDKVMQTYGMMKTLSGEELEEAREVLLDFLSKRPGTDEHTATVESLTFLRNLKT
jgi:hypothetical protein